MEVSFQVKLAASTTLSRYGSEAFTRSCDHLALERWGERVYSWPLIGRIRMNETLKRFQKPVSGSLRQISCSPLLFAVQCRLPLSSSFTS